MDIKGTTIVGVKRDGKTVIAGDGQVTAGQSVIMKGNAVKVCRIYNDKVVTGLPERLPTLSHSERNWRKCLTSTVAILCEARSLWHNFGAEIRACDN